MGELVPPAASRRLQGVEGLRGVAAASVVVYHVWSHSTPPPNLGGVGPHVLGNLAHGVVLFFALSGFLLYRPFAAAVLRGEERPGFAAYARNRALRILPAYWVILVLVGLVLQTAVLDTTPVLREGALTDPVLLLKDALLIQNYGGDSLSTGIGPAWSLAVEVVFYVLLPVLVLWGAAMARRARTRARRHLALLAPPALLGVAGLAGSIAGGVVGGILDVSFLAYAHLFTAGMLLAVWHVEFEDGRVRLPGWWRAGAIAAMAILAVTGVAIGANPRLPERIETLFFSLVSGLLLALVVFVPRDRPPRLIRVLETRPFVAAGLISYSVYLWHRPLISFLARHGVAAGGGGLALLANLALVASATAALSWLTYRLVEKPSLRWKAPSDAAARREMGLTPAP